MPKILVVEDDEMILKAVKAKLAGSQFKVFEAKDGEAGLACLSQKPDLIWLDIYMPKLDGFGFLAALQSGAYAAYRDIPVIVVTASHGAYDDIKGKFNFQQVKGYFVKSDVSLDKIIEKMKQILSSDSNEEKTFNS